MALETTKLISSGQPVSSRVEKPWRSLQSFQNESQFQAELISLAELPTPQKLTTILEIATTNQLPEIMRRASLSRLENEFLALMAAVTSSSEKNWIPLMRSFLRSHGWKADLRGSPKKHPMDRRDRVLGEIVDQMVGRLKDGFDLKLRDRKKSGYLDPEFVESKLQKMGYDSDEIVAIVQGRKLHGAACIYYKKRHKSKLRPKSILNSYQRFLKRKAVDASK